MLRKLWQLLRRRREHQPRLFWMALHTIEGLRPLRLSPPRYELGTWSVQLGRVACRHDSGLWKIPSTTESVSPTE